MNTLKNALQHAYNGNVIIPKMVNEYFEACSIDKRYKLFWMARDCCMNGCLSGIVKYKGVSYYFNCFDGKITVTLN